MTRDTVEVGGTTVADIFHDDELDEPHLTLTVGDNELDVESMDDYADVSIAGYETDIDDVEPGDGRFQRTFTVRQNGEVVATGLIHARAPTPVDVQFGGSYHVVVPANTPVEIDVRGEPADS